jgi:hypothetical protein
MALRVEMDELKKIKFLNRCKLYHTTGSKEVRGFIDNWMATHPELDQTTPAIG